MPYLTVRQREVLEFIQETIRTRGVAPTLREIAEHFGFASIASAQKHVRLLVEKGFLQRVRHQKRGLLPSPPEPDGDATELPVLGTVAAGSPVESFAADESVSVKVPSYLLGAGEHYALRVRGDSMVDDGILDGDTVVVQSRATAREGETVVALVAGEATLKRFYRAGPGRVRLQPANPLLPPLVVQAGDVQLQGVVVALIRSYT